MYQYVVAFISNMLKQFLSKIIYIMKEILNEYKRFQKKNDYEQYSISGQ